MLAAIFKSRFQKMLGVQFLGTLVTFIDRYGSIPILTYYWGLPLLGEWLLMRVVPTYLAMFEAGFSAASGNRIVALLAEDKSQEAANLYGITSRIITTISIVLMIILALALYFGSPKEWLNVQSLSHETMMMTILLTSLNVVFMFRTQILYALYRSNDQQVYWNSVIQICRFAEFLMVALVAVLGGGVIALAGGIMSTRLAAAIYLTIMAPYKIPLWHIKPDNFSLKQSVPILKSGFGFMLIPMAQAINIQGFVWLIGMMLSPAMAAIFNIYRVYSRVVYQVGHIIGLSLWPELSSYYAQNNMQAFCKYLLKSILGVVFSAFVMCIIGYFMADFIIPYWTLGQVENNPSIIGLLLAVSFLGAVRYVVFTAATATNAHTRLVILEVLINLCAIFVLYYIDLITFLNIGLTLMLIEAIIILFVYSKAIEIVKSK